MNTATALLTLIHHFLERQKLVFAALSDLQPHLLMADSINDRYFQLVQEYRHVPQIGYWGRRHEWRYEIHGRGCKLTHRMTGEPIDWDAPDVRVFDRYWFVDYALWYLEQDVDEEAVCILQEAANRHGGTPQSAMLAMLETLEYGGQLHTAHAVNPNKLALYD